MILIGISSFIIFASYASRGVMQVSSAFTRSRDLDDERIAVCALLIELDEPNAESYETEIREITRNIVIQGGVRRVEQSRIFVDLGPILRWAENELREDFARYVALMEAGLDAGAEGFTAAVHDVLAGAPLPEQFLELPKNEASSLLVSIITSLLRECTLNPECGLDCHLSMRIRHGALSGQLRGPLEDSRLITTRETDSLDYAPNNYWKQTLFHLHPTERDLLDNRLRLFSAQYDSFIDRIANELIQIKSPEKSNGLFRPTIPNVDIRALATRISRDTTFEQFLDFVLDLFWESIDRCLNVVRNVMDTDLKTELKDLFLFLQRDVESILRDQPHEQLKLAIAIAETEAQRSLDQIKEWFRLSKPTVAPDFSLDDLVDIGLQCVRNIYHDFDPVIVKETPKLPPIAESLTLFSDIFFIIFDNIRKHFGGLTRPVVTIHVTDLGNRLGINICNEVAGNTRTADAEDRVSRIRQVISSGSYQQGVRSEGGTGLMKLRKLVGRDATSTSLKFGFDGDQQFFVEFELRTRTVAIV